MRKSVVAAVVGVALTATACGGGGGGGGEGGGSARLAYALWNPDQAPIMEDLAKEFQKEHPEIEVSVQVTPFDQYFTKLQTAIGGGSGPDVFWLNAPNMALYASNDAVLPLAERIKEDDLDLGA
nr:extracellular solute-binding protein [Actinomycetota bacterium]